MTSSRVPPTRRLLALACVLGYSTVCAAGAAAQTSSIPDSIARRIDSAVTRYMSKSGVPGFSIAIGLGERVVWSRAYGLADVENVIPVTTTSVFRTASTGKPMTATAVMQLWQAGRLDLDAPIQRYCPAFPRKRWPITARQLLMHTSGIRDKTPAEETNYRHFASIEASLTIFSADSLLSEPGEVYRYTSYGYDVLGCAIAGASGMSYADYMRRHVWDRAGMTATRIDDPREIVSRRVRGYVRDSMGTLRNSVHDDMSNRIPAGGFVATAEDLARFVVSFMSGKLVNDSTRLMMLSLPRGSNGERVTDGYALGWAVSDWYGVQEAWHGGGTPQASVFLYSLPSKGFTVAFMMNLESVPERGDLAGDLARIVLGPKAPGR